MLHTKQSLLSIEFTNGTTFQAAGYTGWCVEGDVLVVHYPNYNRCIPLYNVRFYEFRTSN